MIETIPAILSVQHITKSYRPGHSVFSDLSFNLGFGESMLVRGPSGSGKTTLLRCIALLEKIDEGIILFDGKPITRLARAPKAVRLNIAMVFQSLHLWPHLTALENVALPLRVVRNMTRSEADSRAFETMRMFQMEEYAMSPTNQLSGGQQQRVAIARAMAHTPQLLLLDEITAGLDQRAAITVYDAVARVHASGTSIVMASHSKDLPIELQEKILDLSSAVDDKLPEHHERDCGCI